MPRLFVAIDLSEDVRETLRALRTDLDGARWTPAAQYHVTLAFLGEVEHERMAEIKAALEQVAGAPLELRLQGLNVFPSRRRPRVLVAGVERAEALTALHARVEAAMENVGFAPENRAFRPHVTIARLTSPPLATLRAYLHRHQDLGHQDLKAAWQADRFHLYESVLRPEAAVHRRRATFVLDAV